MSIPILKAGTYQCVHRHYRMPPRIIVKDHFYGGDEINNMVEVTNPAGRRCAAMHVEFILKHYSPVEKGRSND